MVRGRDLRITRYEPMLFGSAESFFVNLFDAAASKSLKQLNYLFSPYSIVSPR